MPSSIARARKTDIYNDPSFDYSKFWDADQVTVADPSTQQPGLAARGAGLPRQAAIRSLPDRRRPPGLPRRQCRPGHDGPGAAPPARPRAGRRGTAPYVNHHPKAILRQLAAVGLRPREVLSVSNLRHPLAKALLPQSAMLAIERATQGPLGPLYFGPSAFFLMQKSSSRQR
jgi:hypothetical protein